MISQSLISTAMPKETYICPYLVISLLPGIDLLCTYHWWHMDRAQRQLQLLAVVLSWEVFTPLDFRHLCYALVLGGGFVGGKTGKEQE